MPRQSFDPGEDQDIEESRNGSLRTVLDPANGGDIATVFPAGGLASQLPYYFRGKHIDIAGNVSEEYSEPAKGVPFPLASGNVQGLCACQVP